MEDGLYISLDPLNDPKSCTYKLKVKNSERVRKVISGKSESEDTEYPTRDDFSK